MPGQVEDYVHRIGRTARAGAKGTAVSFFTNKNARMAADLVKVLRESKQEVPEKLYDLMRNNRGAGNIYLVRNTRYGYGGGQRSNQGYNARSFPPRENYVPKDVYAQRSQAAPRPYVDYSRNTQDYGQRNQEYGQRNPEYGQRNPNEVQAQTYPRPAIKRSRSPRRY